MLRIRATLPDIHCVRADNNSAEVWTDPMPKYSRCLATEIPRKTQYPLELLDFWRFGLGRPGNFGSFAHLQPIAAQSLGHFDHIFKIRRFYHKRIGPKPVCRINVSNLVRSCQNYHPQRPEPRLLPNPSQHLKPINLWHLQIQ